MAPPACHQEIRNSAASKEIAFFTFENPSSMSKCLIEKEIKAKGGGAKG